MTGVARRRGRLPLIAVLVAASVTSAGAGAAPASSAWREAPPTGRYADVATAELDRWIDEASRRFGVPTTWIRAVIAVESAYDPQARSPAGAQGLMQLMPATYAELRGRHGLGADAFWPRDNLLAGAAYLRLLHDRFGPDGMFPAYNAGPGRYAAHLREGRPLPAETQAYVRRLRRVLAEPAAPEAHPVRSGAPQSPPPQTDSLASPLFVPRALFVSPGSGRDAARQGEIPPAAEGSRGSW